MSRPTDESSVEKGDMQPPRYEEHGELRHNETELLVPQNEDTWTQITSTMQPLVGLLSLIKPSFLSKTSSSKTKLRRTAYLDGLRGFAAFLVYVLHHELWAHEEDFGAEKLEGTWGYHGNYYFAAFWGVRTFFTGGHFAVATFFVLSGYVLSTKPLQLIISGDYAQLGENMASALFRRWLRLFLPIIFTTFLWMNLWYIFDLQIPFRSESTYRFTIWFWYCELKNFTFIFRTGGEPWVQFNPHTWSIPVEMRGSIAIYTALMAFSRCTTKMRLWGECVLIWYFMYVADGSHYALFIAGMLLCDLDLLAINKQLPEWFYIFEPYKTPIFYGMFVISNIAGAPPSFSADIEIVKESPFWRHLVWMVPQAVFDYKWFFLFIAAVTLVASVGRIPVLKRFFETRFCQYLGRVSYMLYLVHGPIMWTLGDRIYAAVGYHREAHKVFLPNWIERFPLPKIGPYGMEFSFLACHVILLPVTLWAAEIFTVLLDDNCLKFTQWLYKRTLAPPSEKDRPWL